MNQEQLNANADVVRGTTTQPILDDTLKNMDIPVRYTPQAIPTTIKFSSRASIKITANGQDHYYTVEYGEERQINDFNEVDIQKERQFLIDDCNQQVDNQIEEIVKTFLK